MPIPRSVLMVELLMSADRVVTAAQGASPVGSAESWSPATIVGHLSLVDVEVWIPRIDLMVQGHASGRPPVLTWWEPDAEATRARFDGATADEAGARLISSRTALLHRLRDLADDEWLATAEHDVFGTLDIEGLMLQVLAHDEEHRASILLGEPEV